MHCLWGWVGASCTSNTSSIPRTMHVYYMYTKTACPNTQLYWMKYSETTEEVRNDCWHTVCIPKHRATRRAESHYSFTVTRMTVTQASESHNHSLVFTLVPMHSQFVKQIESYSIQASLLYKQPAVFVIDSCRRLHVAFLGMYETRYRNNFL